MLKLFTILLLVNFTAMASQAKFSFLAQEYERVNTVQLTWYWLDIYEVELWRPVGGHFKQGDSFILHYKYEKNIKAKALIDTTKDEWQRLKLYKKQESDRWLIELKRLWPDIKDGDTLTTWFSLNETKFYQGRRYLGSVKGAGFSDKFSQIWLHPKSQTAELGGIK